MAYTPQECDLQPRNAAAQRPTAEMDKNSRAREERAQVCLIPPVPAEPKYLGDAGPSFRAITRPVPLSETVEAWRALQRPTAMRVHGREPAGRSSAPKARSYELRWPFHDFESHAWRLRVRRGGAACTLVRAESCLARCAHALPTTSRSRAGRRPRCGPHCAERPRAAQGFDSCFCR